MPQRTRCVFDCEHFDVLHRFPKPFDDRFRQWKEIVGEPLEGKTDKEIHTNYRICNQHFESQYFYPHSKRLARTAYPTLNLDVPALIKEAGTRTDFQAEREQDHQHPLEISDKSQAAGLIVISTVCDQSTINNKVINDLLEETKANYYRKGEEARELAFEIANEKIYPLFDPPHLLKGIRNNLITKDLHYIQDGKKKIAKWDHLKLLLNIDSGEDDLRMCNKLTEAHVLPEKIPKMKVKHAAQVFSQRVSSALRFCAKHKLLPDECADTADVLLLFDHLFDSFNGSSYKKSHKTYKSCLKTNSEHFMLWDKALPILRSMQFKRETKKRDGSVVLHYEQVPSIKNWIHNINSMKHLWNNIKSKHNISCILMRSFNQDPVENFFSCVRSHGARNINPTCQQFLSIYKTLLVNNLNSHHSLGANCEEDSNKMFSNLDSLLTKNIVPPRINEPILTGEMDVDLEENLASGSFSQDPENIIINETKNMWQGML
ncbi:unnamed protein product [Euphydryas editha]|uniref:THAP-type domain-containing protein n=1 Tax=Euphydryas editha TaxID=104508 RepID=A0AAU9UT57_EUPED|nr:unnamed protein product [Euphydryas editha]